MEIIGRYVKLELWEIHGEMFGRITEAMIAAGNCRQVIPGRALLEYRKPRKMSRVKYAFELALSLSAVCSIGWIFARVFCA